MTASDHLAPMQFFHGSPYRFEPGQELTAAGAYVAGAYSPGQNLRHVWATTKPLAAAIHAKARAGTSGHVYEVEPIGDLEVDPLDHSNKTAWRSQAGFRVRRELDPPQRIFDRAFGLEAGE